MSVVIRLKVPIEMHYTVIPMGTSKVNSSRFITNLAALFVTLRSFLYRSTYEGTRQILHNTLRCVKKRVTMYKFCSYRNLDKITKKTKNLIKLKFLNNGR